MHCATTWASWKAIRLGLDEVEGRLAALDKLKRKYGRTLEEVMAFRDEVAKSVDEIENATATPGRA